MKDVIVMQKREIAHTLSRSRSLARGRPPQSTESKGRQN